MKYTAPIVMLAVFEAIAVILWLTKDNIFYLLNFSYIGCSIALGIFLYIKNYKYARRIVQLLVGLYMLIYLGLISRENMQIEGFGIIYFHASSRQQRFITQWQRYSDLSSSDGDGAATHAGRRWYWIFFLIKLRHSPGRDGAGSGMSPSPCRWYLLPPCF